MAKDPVSRRLFWPSAKNREWGLGVFKSLGETGFLGFWDQKPPLFHAFFKKRRIFWGFSFLGKMAKKFVKQKLFCLTFAKNPTPDPTPTFEVPQTPPPLFWQKWPFGQKGTLSSRSSALFWSALDRSPFWLLAKKWGWGLGLFGPIFNGFFFGPKRAP